MVYIIFRYLQNTVFFGSAYCMKSFANHNTTYGHHIVAYAELYDQCYIYEPISTTKSVSLCQCTLCVLSNRTILVCQNIARPHSVLRTQTINLSCELCFVAMPQWRMQWLIGVLLTVRFHKFIFLQLAEIAPSGHFPSLRLPWDQATCTRNSTFP